MLPKMNVIKYKTESEKANLDLSLILITRTANTIEKNDTGMYKYHLMVRLKRGNTLINKRTVSIIILYCLDLLLKR